MILVTGRGWRTASALWGLGLENSRSISRLVWSRLVDLSRLSIMSTWSTSVTWLVFLFWNLGMARLVLVTYTTARMTRQAAMLVPISRDNTKDIFDGVTGEAGRQLLGM